MVSAGSGSAKPLPQALVLHTTWRGRLLFLTAPLVLLGLGGYGIVFGGFQIFNSILAVIGLLLLAASLLDFPLYSVVGPEGVERRCLLRRERRAWSELRTIARPANRGIASRVRSGLGTGNSSGLVAEIGARPSLLTDRIESPAEFDALENAMAQWVPGMVLRASRPTDGTAPTWLYKRRLGDGEGLIDALHVERDRDR